MTHSQEDREFWFLQPRASNDMQIDEEGFRAFSRLFIRRSPKIIQADDDISSGNMPGEG